MLTAAITIAIAAAVLALPRFVRAWRREDRRQNRILQQFNHDKTRMDMAEAASSPTGV